MTASGLRLVSVIERRLLVNYRVDPDIAARLLPPPLRPRLVEGTAVAGICLVRLGGLRPAGFPSWVGMRSESAAHRFAVQWRDAGRHRLGVYIPRRHTSSTVAALAGGRLFPGRLDGATFSVAEAPGQLRIAVASRDDAVRVRVEARPDVDQGGGDLFDPCLGGADAADFFTSGAVAWSPSRTAHRLDGIELRTAGAELAPAAMDRVESSYFDDRRRFPAGTAVLDSAFVMRDVVASWRAVPALPVGEAPVGVLPRGRAPVC